MRVIDAHHHFWDPDQNYYPWLCDRPLIPFRYGDYSAICGRFMPADYDQISQGWDVVASVTMEGEMDPADPVREAEWIGELAEKAGRPAAHVAQIWLDRDDCAAVIERYADLPHVRSVRHKPHANMASGQGAGGLSDPAYLHGVALLAKSGLMFDLQTPWWHLAEIAMLRKISADMPIIINHTGLPSDRSPEGIAGWRCALQEASGFENTYLKISGLGLCGRPWRLEDNRDIIRFAIDTFGAERAMFASNFPVDGLCGSFNTIFSGFDAACSDYSDVERTALFHDTVAKVYRLDLR